MLNSNITAVEYDGTGAWVKLGNEVVLDAHVVITTVSLSVLQSNMVQFKPLLSQENKNLLAKMMIRSYIKIYI